MWVAGCFELIEESQQRLLKTLALIDWCTSSNCVGVGRSKWRRIGKSRLCVRKKLSFWSLLSDPLFRVGSWKGLVCQLASTFFRRVKNPVFVDSHSMLSTRRYLEILVANIWGNCFPPKISCTMNTYFCYSHTVLQCKWILRPIQRTSFYCFTAPEYLRRHFESCPNIAPQRSSTRCCPIWWWRWQ